VEAVEPTAKRIGAALESTRTLIGRNGALRQREAVAELGEVRALGGWLADRFGEPP
jgi:hypothetical protein